MHERKPIMRINENTCVYCYFYLMEYFHPIQELR